MTKILELSRRRFLRLLTMIGLTRCVRYSRMTAALAAVPPRPAPGYRALNARQVAILEAIVEQIIPADEDPGAREADVANYIDKILVGDQRDKLPFYVAGLEATDETSRAMFGRQFVDLSFEQRTTVLKTVERGEAKGKRWKEVSSAEFFSMVWRHALEGFYGPPSYGGNKDHASWKMIGYPIEH